MCPHDDTADADVTADVGSEGGSPGDLEVERDPVPATGSEGGETWQPANDDLETVVRDNAHPSAFAEATADRRSAKRGGWSTGSGGAAVGVS
jgi:hypothetical protein